jgi:hypothetical protein
MGWEGVAGGQSDWKTLANPLAFAVGKLPAHGVSHLFEKTCANGAGELGESVYGLKADFRWPAVGEGMSWVAVAMLHLASQTPRWDCAAKLNLCRAACGRATGCLSRQHAAMFDVRKAERQVRWEDESGGDARRESTGRA